MRGSIEVCAAGIRFPREGRRREQLLRWAWGRLGRGAGAGFWALRDVSFRANAGEVLGLIGANGSGKSSLLRLIARVYEPDAGSVRAHGRVGALLELGAGFKDELNGVENIRLDGAILGFSAAELERHLDAILDFAALGDAIDEPLRTYSSGMRARLGFAIATALSPDVLIVDEALAVGDEQFRKKSLARIEALAAQGVTLLVASHDLPELARLCPRSLLLHRGRLVADASTADVIAQYRALGAGAA